MIKKFYSELFILIVVQCCSYGESITDFLYDKSQIFLDKILNVVPPTKNDEKKNIPQEPKNNINNINNVNNIINEEEEIHEEIGQPANKKNTEKEYAQLIEKHYIWVAFMGTLLNHYKIYQLPDNDNLPMNLPMINLNLFVKDFFNESLENDTTIKMLSRYFDEYSLNDNFIAKDKTFFQIIYQISKEFKDNNNSNLFNIILDLQQKIGEDNNKKKVSLFWMFTVAIGKYVADKLSKKAKQFLNDNLYGGDYIKTNTLKYIDKSFKERAVLYQKLEKMFLLFYKLAGNNVNEKTFIDQVYKNMVNNLNDKCFRKSFTNLMYRNLDRERNHINLIEIMML